ncbi:hypothetical protein MD484_g8511, partial [Candolleomyces efflorescens]
MQEGQKEVILFAVIGQTGAGKSSFVNSVLGGAVASTSDGIFSCTKTVAAYQTGEDSPVTLVDVPGFNHSTAEGSSLTDEDILRMVDEFLEYKFGGQKLSGIVFLHRINGDPEPEPNARLLQKLCLNNKLGHPIVVTTHWDEVCCDQNALLDAEEREQALKSDGYPNLFDTAEIPFLRVGYFDDDVPQHCQLPAAIVEGLLREVQSNDAGVESYEAESELGLECESDSLDDHEQAQSGEMKTSDLEATQDIVQLTLTKLTENINKTVEDSRVQFSARVEDQEDLPEASEGYQDQLSKSAISTELLEIQAKLNATATHDTEVFECPAAEELNNRIDGLQKSHDKLLVRWRFWEDYQKSLAATQSEELLKIHSEILHVKEVVQSLAAGWRTESNTRQKEHDELLSLRAREREMLLLWKLHEVQGENARLTQQLSAKETKVAKAVQTERITTSSNIENAELRTEMAEGERRVRCPEKKAEESLPAQWEVSARGPAAASAQD